jgi:hypothetical protein
MQQEHRGSGSGVGVEQVDTAGNAAYGQSEFLGFFD